jgi:hypothetical protein
MTELIIGICILAIMILLHVQGKTIDKQQSQIEVLRETLTEYMFNMTKFVQAQNDANEAVINTLALDEEKGKHYFETLMTLGKHVEYIDEELQKCRIAVQLKKGV